MKCHMLFNEEAHLVVHLRTNVLFYVLFLSLLFEAFRKISFEPVKNYLDLFISKKCVCKVTDGSTLKVAQV